LTIVSRAQVLLFLVEAKKLIAEGKWDLVPRKKNLDTLALLGWNDAVLIDFLNSLVPANYVSGPVADRDIPGEDVWTFGAEIEGEEYYIKLKLKTNQQLLCLSFHKAEYPLKYPYRR